MAYLQKARKVVLTNSQAVLQIILSWKCEANIREVHGHINRNRQHYTQSLVVKSGTINLFPGQGPNPDFRQCRIKENHNTKNELDNKTYEENIYMNTTRPMIFSSSCIQLALLYLIL